MNRAERQATNLIKGVKRDVSKTKRVIIKQKGRRTVVQTVKNVLTGSRVCTTGGDVWPVKPYNIGGIAYVAV